METAAFSIFISHSSADWPLAMAVKALLCCATRIGPEKVFCSSDGFSLKTGEKMDGQIVAAHREAEAVVTIMTPNSMFRHWVLMESGGAHFGVGKRLYVMISNGLTMDCLPSPLSYWQIGDLSKQPDIEALCRDIATHVGNGAEPIPFDLLERVRLSASTGGGVNWARVKPVLCSEKHWNSPFTFREILNELSPHAGKRKIYIFGADMRLLETDFRGPDGAKAEVMRWLRGDNSREFRAVLFSNDLTDGEVRRRLLEWTRDAPLSQGAGFKARFSPTPLQDVVFVDPKCSHGYAVIWAARPNRASAEVLQFVLWRKDGPVFEGFWESCRQHMLDHCVEVM